MTKVKRPYLLEKAFLHASVVLIEVKNCLQIGLYGSTVNS